MKKILLLTITLFSIGALSAQTKSELYNELPNPTATDASQWAKMTASTPPQVSWGSTDVRYKKEIPPTLKLQKELTLTAWKGEKVSAQLVIWSSTQIDALAASIGSLKSAKGEITAENVRTAFARYVMTDELNKDRKSGCGRRNSADFDSSLVADPLDHLTQALMIPARSTQGVWISVSVPQQTLPGIYSGKVSVRNGEKLLGELKLNVKVLNHTLPAPSEWAFHLDLWQNPYAVARYYNVEPFSKEHFDLMRPVMKLYANAGGKVITASIMHKPWNGQTYDPFESMVTWLKKADGTWAFDFTTFDKWVEFMMSVGVKNEINCYSMVPWKLTFQYFDQASNSFKFVTAKPGEAAYEEFWSPMLRAFAQHLKEKGWFGITHIAMDERPMEDMLKTMAVIHKVDKDFKVSLAGACHDELFQTVDDYCVHLAQSFPPEVIAARTKAGMKTTYYTSCAEARPNTFTFSPPAEAEWLGWFAAKENLSGYLRWAFNSWVKEPLLDSRFITWAAGDTYMVYPGGRSSIRFERLTEGIQAYEKVRILKEEYTNKGNKTALKQLEKILKPFDRFGLDKFPPTITVKQAKDAINRL